MWLRNASSVGPSAMLSSPKNDPKLSDSVDFLLAFGQERADSFRSWHVTKQRSLDHLDVALGRKAPARWTTYTTEEIKGDILYKASSLTASTTPNYPEFINFIHEYKKIPSKDYLENALLEIANDVRNRVRSTSGLELCHSRASGLVKIMIGLTEPFPTFDSLDDSLTKKLREILLKPDAPQT